MLTQVERRRGSHILHVNSDPQTLRFESSKVDGSWLSGPPAGTGKGSVSVRSPPSFLVPQIPSIAEIFEFQQRGLSNEAPSPESLVNTQDTGAVLRGTLMVGGRNVLAREGVFWRLSVGAQTTIVVSYHDHLNIRFISIPFLTVLDRVFGCRKGLVSHFHARTKPSEQ